MITLDAIVGLQRVRRGTETMCSACGRTYENAVYMYHPGDALATYIYFPSCGHMEARGAAGAWRTHTLHALHASAQAYLMLLDEGEEP